MKLQIYFLVFILFSQSALGARHFGHDQGNGGDLWSLQFIAVGEELVTELNQIVSCENSLIDATAFQVAIRNTRVESTREDLYLDGRPKDAINFPAQQLILFNSLRWEQMNRRERRAFVRHEYSSIIGKENATYLSSRTHMVEALPMVDHVWCTVGNEGGHISLGVDESTVEAETILLGFQLSADTEDFATDALILTTGSFQNMMDSGRLFMQFNSGGDDNGYILTLNKGPDGFMAGQLYIDGIEHPVRCEHPAHLPPPTD